MAVANVKHAISEDGLSLTSTAELSRGTFRTTVYWHDTDTALTNYERAMIGFERKAAEVDSGEVKVDPGERKRLRKMTLFGQTFWLTLETGPPTWWLPNIGMELSGDKRYIRGGWLNAAVQVLF